MIDRNMIDLDKKLFEEQEQKTRDRDLRSKQIRQETLQQELDMKQLANNKKVSFGFYLFKDI